ncbi:MAG: FtsX-like permease family protein [Magnetococcales bacterium]|nr:FtsX-like permease family protein [Magnetococcales bacterium]
MISTLRRASLRHFSAHPWLSLLAIIGIALGVAVVTAVDLANEGAVRAMRVATEAISGRATHRILGASSGIPEAFYTQVRLNLGIRHAAPIIEGLVTTPNHPGGALSLLGVDLLAEPPFRGYLNHVVTPGDDSEGASNSPPLLTPLLTQPATALLHIDTARRMGLSSGDDFAILAGGEIQSLTLIALFDPPDPLAREGLRETLIVDIATAQEVLKQPGVVSRIDLILPDDALGLAQRQKLEAALPGGVRLHGAGERAQAMENLTRAFRLNLTALSLLALLVGMFIIYNTVTFSVVQRRHLLGLLRALGVTRRELFLRLMADGLLMGVPGTLLGLGLGVLLGEGLVGLVARTVNDLYFHLQVTDFHADRVVLLKGAVLGVGATLVAAIPPAWEAVSSPTAVVLSRADLEGRAHQALSRGGWIGIGLLLMAGMMVLIPSRHLAWGFVALFGLMIGYALLIPPSALWLLGRVQGGMRRLFGPLGGVAPGGVGRNLSRTGVALAALSVAVATALGMEILISSFRTTVVDWLHTYLRADIYVTAIHPGPATQRPLLDPLLIDKISATPGLASVGLSRKVTLPTPGEPTDLWILDLPKERFSGFDFIDDSAPRLWPRFQRGDGVILTESMAFRRGLEVGDSLTLPTVQGVIDFAIIGIHYDYGSDTGVVTMSMTTFRKHWQDFGVSGLGLGVAHGVDVVEVIEAIRLAAGEVPLNIRSTRQIREASMVVFDRTFAITRVLRTLAVLVAFFGMLTALTAIQLERTREFAVFRALGLTPKELWRIIAYETGLMGLAAGLLAIPLGVIQGALLIHVINHRSFGWSLEMHVEPMIFFQALLIALPTALLAGVFPAWRISRIPPAEALREA